MPILVVGANYRSCPIEVRERLAFRAEQLPAAYAALRDHVGLAESLILSTCNRVEIYAQVPRLGGTAGKLASFLGAHSRLAPEALQPQLYSYTDPASIRHLFRVTSGLDSMVLGETEILHQVKHAYEQAKQHGTTGRTLNVLFQKALNAGKAVRSQTAISTGCLSVGTVAIELAQKIFGDLRPYTVLLAGTGKIGEMVIQRLTERGVSNVRILNRTLERAQALAAQHGGQAHGLEELPAQVAGSDIAITSTATSAAILTRADVERIMGARHHRPLCLIDLGVPRNIEPEAGKLENVYLFDIDDLQGLIDHHHQRREQALQAAEAIVGQKVSGCARLLSSEPAPAP